MVSAAGSVDAERFVRAWERFRRRFPEDAISDEHHGMLKQYLHTTDVYLNHSVKLPDALERAMKTIAADVAELTKRKCITALDSRFYIPRPEEITLEKRSRAARLDSEVSPEEFPQHAKEEADPVHGLDHVEMMSVTDDDLQYMLKPRDPASETLSTSEMRRRLGLSGRQDPNQSASTMAQEEQESIQSDMIGLAKTLKERTQGINTTLVDDIKIIDAVEERVETNAKLLERENNNLKQQLASSIGFWTSLWLIMGAVMVFMAMYIYMKLFSRRQYY